MQTLASVSSGCLLVLLGLLGHGELVAAGLEPVAADDEGIIVGSLDLNVSTDVLLNDQIGDGPVTVSIVTAAANGTSTVRTDPVFYNYIFYEPNQDFIGTDTIVYRVRDRDGDTDEATLTYNVIARGSCTNDVADTPRDTPITVNVVANDSDFNQTPVTVTLFGTPGLGSAVVNQDDSITYTPEPGTGGPVEIIYDVKREFPTPAGGACSLTVNVDDKPTARDDASLLLKNSTERPLNVYQNDTGLSDQPTRVTVLDPPEHGTVRTPEGADVFYTPDTDFTGMDTLSYQVTDSNGDSDTATAIIYVVDGVGDCSDDSVDTELNTPVTVEVLANDADFAPPVQLLAVRIPPEVGTAVVNANETITYTPATDTGGPAEMLYIVASDDLLGAACALTVNVDDLPVAVDDSLTVEINSPQELDVLANDTQGADTPVRLSIPRPPNHGSAEVVTVTLPNNQKQDRIRFTPDEDFVGYDDLEYRVTDANGDHDRAILNLTIVGNAIPVAGEDRYALNQDIRATLDILRNDVGLGNKPVVLEILLEPVHGQARVNDADNTISYMPDAGFIGAEAEACTNADGEPVGVCTDDAGSREFCTDENGDLEPNCDLPGGDRLRYRITDADGESAEALVEIDVFPQPVADSGGSALGTDLLVLLAGAGFVRRRLQAAARVQGGARGRS